MSNEHDPKQQPNYDHESAPEQAAISPRKLVEKFLCRVKSLDGITSSAQQTRNRCQKRGVVINDVYRIGFEIHKSFVIHGQREKENRPARFIVPTPYFSAMRLDDSVRDGQS